MPTSSGIHDHKILILDFGSQFTQLIARRVREAGVYCGADHSEFGYATVRARGHSVLLKDIQDHVNDEGHGLLDVWMSHGDRVETLPDGFKLIASSDNAPIAGFADEARHLYALQFHVEVTHTQQGAAIINRFVHQICECDSEWQPASIADNCIKQVREQVASDGVLLGLSGGVDSFLT